MNIAIITGASSGIGMEFARQISRKYPELDEIWLVARRKDRLIKFSEHLQAGVRVFGGDLLDHDVYNDVEEALAKTKGKVRFLVNAAGYGKMGTVKDLDVKEQLGMIDLNCFALTKMTLLVLPYMTKGGNIIQVASAAAFAPQPGFSIYAATKSYVYSFSRSLNAELKEKGIHVTAVCPGPVQTEFFDRSGNLPRNPMLNRRAKAKDVVKKALKDAACKKAVSVYGLSMNVSGIASGLLPDGLIIRVNGSI